jgi:hypothetical protein
MDLFDDRGIVVSYAIPFKRPTRARSLDVGTQPWSVDESRAIRKLCRMKSPELTTAFWDGFSAGVTDCGTVSPVMKS